MIYILGIYFRLHDIFRFFFKLNELYNQYKKYFLVPSVWLVSDHFSSINKSVIFLQLHVCLKLHSYLNVVNIYCYSIIDKFTSKRSVKLIKKTYQNFFFKYSEINYHSEKLNSIQLNVLTSLHQSKYIDVFYKLVFFSYHYFYSLE